MKIKSSKKLNKLFQKISDLDSEKGSDLWNVEDIMSKAKFGNYFNNDKYDCFSFEKGILSISDNKKFCYRIENDVAVVYFIGTFSKIEKILKTKLNEEI